MDLSKLKRTNSIRDIGLMLAGVGITFNLMYALAMWMSNQEPWQNIGLALLFVYFGYTTFRDTPPPEVCGDCLIHNRAPIADHCPACGERMP